VLNGRKINNFNDNNNSEEAWHTNSTTISFPKTTKELMKFSSLNC